MPLVDPSQITPMDMLDMKVGDNVMLLFCFSYCSLFSSLCILIPLVFIFFLVFEHFFYLIVCVFLGGSYLYYLV